MNTWAPLFSKIVDSSLWDEDDFTVKVFITMLAKKDADHVVRGSAYNIAQWAKKPREEARVIEALKRLQQPDRRRLEPQPYDGRRIEKVEDGWLILNGQHYEDQMRKINRREYKTQKQREYRAKRSSTTQTERLMDKAETAEDLARVEEMAAEAPAGLFGSKGPEAQEVVRAKVDAEGQDSGGGFDDTPDPDAV